MKHDDRMPKRCYLSAFENRIAIFIPCKGFTSTGKATGGAYLREIHKKVPTITTLEVSTDKRGKKLFADFSQNDLADTLAAVSVRSAKQPNVSASLEWDELNNNFKPSNFTIENMLARQQQKGNL